MPRYRPYLFAALLMIPTVIVRAAGDLDSLRQAAQKYYRDGQYDKATTLYNRMAVDNPKNVPVLKEAMWGLWNMQATAPAVQLAGQVLALDPSDVEAKNIQIWAKSATSKDQASSLRKKAVEAYQQGRYADSATAYKALASIEPDNISTLKDWMSALWAAHQYSETEKVARRILAVHPNDPHALEMMQQLPDKLAQEKLRVIMEDAATNGKRDQLAVAIKLDEEMVKLRPNDPDSYRNLAMSYYRLQRYSEAKVIASLRATLAPEDPESWNLLGRIEVGLKETEEAIRDYERSLSLNPHQQSTLLAIGRLLLEQRDFSRSLPYLQKASEMSGPDQGDTYPLLGKALFWMDRFSESVAAWNKAVTRFPDKPSIQFQRAMAIYYSGEHAKAIKVLENLYDSTHYDPAASFLADDYVARGDPARAQEILERTLSNPDAFDEARAMRLLGLYRDNGPKNKITPLVDKVLKRWPMHLDALMIKAEVLRGQQKFREAKATYEKVLALNPHQHDAITELSELEHEMGHENAALTLAKRLSAWDPTSLDYALFQSRLLYDKGDYVSAKHILRKWLKENESEPQILTILLYHGLTPLVDDAMLAYPYHHSIATFEDHMKALHDAGYTAVTLPEVDAWMDHRGDLPEKAVVIAFDDARYDSFKYADPILEKYGLKATMFVPIVNIDGNQPIGYASWARLDQYRSTGRWDMQAHGDEAHVRVPLDPNGLHGPFLANRSWLETQKRMESVDEWKFRIARDYESNRQKMSEHLGQTPIGYAFPEGVYGQQDQVNTPEAAPTNRDLVMRYYRMAFVQNQYGTNLRKTDRALMTRLEPNNDWTGQQLLDHQRDTNPFNRVYLQLLDWATAEDRSHEAYSWWKKLKANGASEHTLATREAIIRLTAGDYAEGYAMAQRSLLGEDVGDTKITIEKYLVKERWEFAADYRWHTEVPNRTDWYGGARLDFPRFSDGLRLSGLYGYEQLNERNAPFIDGQALGLGLNYAFGISHELTATALQHGYHSPAQHVMEGVASLESRWTDALDSVVSASYNPVPTASALAAHISYIEGLFKLHWFEDSLWTAEGSERFRSYSDRNERSTAEFLLARRLWSVLNLRGVAHVSYDGTKDRSSFYYSPQSLLLAGIGPEISGVWRRRMTWSMQYWPAYAQEHDTPSEWDNNAEVSFNLKLGKTSSLKTSYLLYQSPSLLEHTVEVECAIPF